MNETRKQREKERKKRERKRKENEGRSKEKRRERDETREARKISIHSWKATQAKRKKEDKKRKGKKYQQILQALLSSRTIAEERKRIKREEEFSSTYSCFVLCIVYPFISSSSLSPIQKRRDGESDRAIGTEIQEK